MTKPPPATDLALPTTYVGNLTEYDGLAEGAFEPNTKRAMVADQRLFAAYCDQMGAAPMPATAKTVMGFVRAMAEAGRRPASIRRYVATIAHVHRAAKAPDPTKDSAVKLALRAMHKEKGRAQKQAAPFKREHVAIALRPRTRLSLRDLRQRAIVAVAYDTLARASELVRMQVREITPAANGAATILIARAKNDPDGVGSDRYLHTDTMNHVRAWLLAAGLVDGPLFRAVLKGGVVGGPLHVCEISRALRELAPKSAGRVSGHSLRIGACQDMAAAGIELLEIQQAGGWASPPLRKSGFDALLTLRQPRTPPRAASRRRIG
jgi:site-specific recombinase XerD